jgi:ribonuclease PH
MLTAVVILVAIAVGLFVVTLRSIKRAEQAMATAEYEANERARSERMAREMLKERSREDVARDLDRGEF